MIGAGIECAYAFEPVRQLQYLWIRQRLASIAVPGLPMLDHCAPGKLEILGNAFVAFGAIDQVNDVTHLVVGLLLQDLYVFTVLSSAGSFFKRFAIALRTFCARLYRSVAARLRLE